MRIAIVNDLTLAVEALRRAIVLAPGYELAWIARDGREAVERCRMDRPDLVLMDLIMPVMDGVEATRRIMAETPCAILVVTASVRKNATKVFEAMGYGALDAVNTPSFGLKSSPDWGAPLLAKIDTISRLLGKPGGAAPVSPPAPMNPGAYCPPVIALGASTGGPAICARILAGLRPGLGAAVVVVQHIDAHFSQGLAQWLGQHTTLPVALAEAGNSPQIDQVHVARGDEHLRLDHRARFASGLEPGGRFYRPSIDVFFESLATLPRGSAVGVLLTGMGRDGAEGMRELHRCGHRTLAQDPATCLVDSMPAAAIALGAASQILGPDALITALQSAFRPTRPAAL